MASTSAETDHERPAYNARITHLRLMHDALMRVRIVPDSGVPRFTAGQYATLALGDWEPRVEGHSIPSGADSQHPRLIKRAYSISCPLLSDYGQLVTCGALDYLEFYIARVLHPNDDPPKLTPRLFQLRVGSRLYMAPHIHGAYRLNAVADDDAVLFLATGTGEAPHNAMLAELLAHGHAGPIISVACVRYRKDLGYLDAHRELEQRYPQYRYVALTTREPENLDRSRSDYVGKQYLQEFLSSGRLEHHLGVPIDPSRTHAFLCGNPEMIGLPPAVKGGTAPPPEGGMVALLISRGFTLDQPHHPGNIHFERYW